MNKHGNILLYTSLLSLFLITEMGCKEHMPKTHLNLPHKGCETSVFDGMKTKCENTTNSENVTDKTTQKPSLPETTKHEETTSPQTTLKPYNIPEDKDNKLIDISHPNTRNTKLGTTSSAALAAGICVAIALAGYISLMIWKNVTSRRYGNSEILLNEDDVADIQDEDMKHFEAACIQIEA